MTEENQIQEGDRNNERPFDSQILNCNILKMQMLVQCLILKDNFMG